MVNVSVVCSERLKFGMLVVGLDVSDSRGAAVLDSIGATLCVEAEMPFVDRDARWCDDLSVGLFGGPLSC